MKKRGGSFYQEGDILDRKLQILFKLSQEVNIRNRKENSEYSVAFELYAD